MKVPQCWILFSDGCLCGDSLCVCVCVCVCVCKCVCMRVCKTGRVREMRLGRRLFR